MDLVYVLIVNELALIAVGAESRCLLVPLLAHFCFVIFIETLRRCLYDQFCIAMRIGALLIELARARFHKVAAQLCFVIDLEVFNVPKHLFA